MSGIDRQLEQLFLAERRRTASIIGEAATLAWHKSHGVDVALEVIARHVEYGDAQGTLYGECDRCRDYEGKRRRTEVPLGDETVPCAECGNVLPFVR